MRIHFDLEGIPPYFRARWDTRLAEWFSASPGAVTSVATPDEADAILVLGRVRHWGQVRKAGLDDVHPHKTFALDSSDFPSGRIAGLYAGLPRELYEPNRHRTFCYPFRWNELVAEYPQAEATQLAGFLGAITSPLRPDSLAAAPRAERTWLIARPSFPSPAGRAPAGPCRKMPENASHSGQTPPSAPSIC